MPLKSADLAQPIDWTDAKFAPMLRDLQGNILKGHGRPATRLLFFTMKPNRAVEARRGLKAMSALVTSALEQLEAAKALRETGQAGEAVTFAFLTHAGYKAVKAKSTRIPRDEAFVAGMGAPSRQRMLADPPRESWDNGLGRAVHAMILIGDSSQALCRHRETAVRAALNGGWQLVHVEEGQAIFDAAGQGLEHFGYVDGRSQPLMLADEVAREAAQGGIDRWNPAFGPGAIALVPDPAGRGPDSFGSYMVFRKLEQDVAGFKAAEAMLARAQRRAALEAGLSGNALPDPALAGAMMVGRFEDGSTVIDHAEPKGQAPGNNFNYATDPQGSRCPRHAHIRKANPRNGSERASIMPRRGIPYGGELGGAGERGLLFMAYNRDISAQFEFIQRDWANNADFPLAETGVDPLTGQSTTEGGRRTAFSGCPVAHGHDGRFAGDFQSFVTMRGGEYFFAPSISGLAALI